jgi:hypothetical protein
MKIIFSLFAFLFISIAIHSQEFKFEAETIDYGTIEKGSNGVRVFEFINTGDEPLIISKVSSSCGCTIPKKPKEPILPGKTGVIEVKYDTNRVNPIRKTITVLSNAETPTIALKIKGLVIDPSKVSILDKKEKSVMQQ